jgi:hypothetical protein
MGELLVLSNRRWVRQRELATAAVARRRRSNRFRRVFAHGRRKEEEKLGVRECYERRGGAPG